MTGDGVAKFSLGQFDWKVLDYVQKLVGGTQLDLLVCDFKVTYLRCIEYKAALLASFNYNFSLFAIEHYDIFTV